VRAHTAAGDRRRPGRRSRAESAAGIPAGTRLVGAGLAILGVSSYGYLAFAARSLDQAQFAELSVVWTILFTLGPGAFLPLEQEIGRRVAVVTEQRIAAVILRRAAGLGAVLAVVITVLTVMAGPVISDRLLNGDTALFIAMLCANATLALVHSSRGFLSGTGRFGRYGGQLAIDGAVRMAGAGFLLLAAVHEPSAFGWVLVGSQLIAVSATLWRTHPPLDPGEKAMDLDPHMSTLARSMGWMLCGTIAAQVLANAGPIVVKTLAAPTDAAAGQFLTALVLARVPLFLFAAVQASLLPGLAKLIGLGERRAVFPAIRRLLLLLAAIGGLVTVLLLLAGPSITAVLFGPDYRSTRAPLVLLSAGCTVYMLGGAIAQALLALHRPKSVALGWWLGVAGFFAALIIGGGLATRVSAALLVGSVVSGCWFAWSLKRHLASAEPRHVADPGEVASL